MKHVTTILQENDFSYSVEIIPPRNGISFEYIFQWIQNLADANFDFISVTHGAGGSLRGGTMPICHFAQEKQRLTAIAHLTCRSSSKEDLENTLIDHHYFDIRNILALRGDPPDGMDQVFKPVENGFSYAYELISLVANMNKGRYLIRKNFDDNQQEFREGVPTDFCIGVACYPEATEGKDIEYLEIKKNRGGQFAITQLIYDVTILKSFLNKVKNKWSDTFVQLQLRSVMKI